MYVPVDNSQTVATSVCINLIYLVSEHLDPAVSPMYWIGAVSINVLICVCDEVHGHTSHSLLRGELSTKAVHTKNDL